MSALKQMANGLRSMWGHAEDDDDFGPDEFDEPESAPNSYGDSAAQRSHKYEKYTTPPPSIHNHTPSHGGGDGGHLRTLRPLPNPLRSAREKNIYTLKPKSMDEASLAADYLKTGCAVVLNLEEVERLTAVRIIDFMSGVSYGLEHQGHAMKLGETIFLFTPGDFEISSDETDYGENRDFIFKDVAAREAAATTPAPSASTPSYNTAAPRPWER